MSNSILSTYRCVQVIQLMAVQSFGINPDKLRIFNYLTFHPLTDVLGFPSNLFILQFINQNGSLPSRNRNRNLWVSENARLGYNIGELWVTGNFSFSVYHNINVTFCSLTGSSKVVVCNIHVLYNPNRGEIKLGQVRVLLDKAKAVYKLWNDTPVVICGDFNCTPKATSTEGDIEVIEQNNSRLDTRDLDTKCHSLANQLGSIKEPNPSYSEGRLHIDHVNGEIHDITPVTSSAPEEVHNDATWIGSNEHIPDAVSTSNKESNLHVPEGNKHVEFDCAATSLQEDDQSSKVRIDLESIDLDNVEISSMEPSSQSSVSCVFEDGDSPSHEEIANDQNNCSSTSYLVDKSHHLSNIDFPPDVKEKAFFDETDKTVIGVESEDDIRLISSLHNAEEVALDLGPSMKSYLEKPYQSEELDSASNDLLLPVESNEMEHDLSPRQISKSINSEQATYNPALWTPMEINRNCNRKCRMHLLGAPFTA
ncbi:Carbon catabolite repressor protein 4 6 [Glycine max]|nr:Carbon catabolite repressor protein 4 6 [Glycine max]